MKKNVLIGGLIAGAFIVGSFGSAEAASLIGHAGLKDGAVHSDTIRDGAVHQRDLANGARHLLNTDSDVLSNGAILRTAHYDNGGGGIATASCGDDEATSQKYIAVSGGARVDVPGQGTATEPMTSSFAGRMDWSTNTPKPGRLDGWIVKFGNGAAPGTAEGDVLEVYALCVPIASLTTQVSHY